MTKAESFRELDDFLKQLNSPTVSPDIRSKTSAEQTELVESLIGLITDLIGERQWDRAWRASITAEEITKGLSNQRLLAEIVFRRGLWHYHQGALLPASKEWEHALS